MRNFLIMGHLFVMAIMVCSGAFVWLGLPFNENLGGLVCLSVAYLGFERLCSLCGVIK